MKKSKRSAAVLLCGMCLLVKPAYAFWPVFDFSEIVPVFQQIKTAKDSITEAQASLTMLNETKKSIGGVGSIASFSESLAVPNLKDIAAFSGKVSDAQQDTVQIASAAPQIIAGAFSSVTAAQAGSVREFVDNIESKIFKSPASQAIMVSYNDILPFAFIEEEEEEVVSDEKIKAKQDELIFELNAVMDENKQLATELNDILASLLTSLNQAAAANNASLAELDGVIKNTNVIQADDKGRLKIRIEALSVKQQNMTDRATSLIEEIQNNYNEEFNRVIKDGTGNYVKTAVAYLKGDEEKASVMTAGDKLKNQVMALNVVSNGENLNEIEAESKDILKETEKLKEEMREMLKNSKR